MKVGKVRVGRGILKPLRVFFKTIKYLILQKEKITALKLIWVIDKWVTITQETLRNFTQSKKQN